MNKIEAIEVVKTWNLWDGDLETGVEREAYVDELLRLLGSGQVAMVTGVRRSGKSYILRQAAKKLIEQGVGRKDMVIINFEDVRLEVRNVKDLIGLYESIEEQLGGEKPKIVFLDEVQKVAGWEAWVRTMHELNKAKIVVSGSNSQLMSREMGTKLTGRHLDLTVYPMNLAEFMKFKRGEKVKMYLRNYLHEGGFPLAVLEPQMGKELLLSYFGDILQKDVIDRYAIRKKSELIAVAKYLVGNFSSQMTYGSIAKFLALTPVTVRQFVRYLEEAFLIFAVPRYDRRPKLVEKSPRKIYCVDTGMANAVGVGTGQNIGRLAENCVYLELRRRKKEVWYWKDEQHREIDFVYEEEGGLKAMQVCWNVGDFKTKQREVKSLILGLESLGLDGGMILTEDFEGEETVANKTIKYWRLSDWLVGGRNE